MDRKDIISATHHLLCKKQLSCLQHGTNFSVPLNEVRDMVATGVDAYTGEPFKHPSHITFERINPFLGYVSGNVCLVSLQVNQHKSQLDAFVKGVAIDDAMKIKLMRKAIYVLEKQNKGV